jgi:hypothetical protein
MRRILAAALLLLVLPGCATRPTGQTTPVSTYAGSDYVPPEEVAVTHSVLSVVATPFYWIFKAVVCATTAVIAIPGAAVLALTEPSFEARQRGDLDEGVARNCGPPYVVP